MYWPISLAQLPLDRKQSLVNEMYDSHRHVARMAAQNPRAHNIDLGHDYVAGRWRFSLEEILELCPPERSAAEWVDLTNPPFLPIWVCRGDGKLVFVLSEDELKQEVVRQPQCYGPTPDGPWYGGSANSWPYLWKEATKGLFAPSPYGSHQPGGPQAVYTTAPLVYHGQAIFTGALFLLKDPFNDKRLLSDGIVEEVKSHYYEDMFEHELTHWWFMNKSLRDDYGQRYKACDLGGIPWRVHPPLEPKHVLPISTTTRKYYPDDEVLEREYRRVYIEQTDLQGSSVSLATVGRNMMPPLKDRTLRRYLKDLGIHHPPQ